MSASRMDLTPDQMLSRRTLGWAVQMGVSPTRIVITEMSEKWGSCAPDGVVTFAQDLVEREPAFQDYVIVHELLHLRYRSHGKAFKAMMTAFIPNWRELQTAGMSC